jgi:two-component system, OmpR family, sensor histidine kinase ChvG
VPDDIRPEMKAESLPEILPAPPAGLGTGMRNSVRLRLRQFWRQLSLRLGSSLVRRIVLLNMAGLVALLLGFLWLNQTRLGVIDARVQSLQVQGEIIAAALAGTALVEGNTILIDPERLLELQAGETAQSDPLASLEFSLNPERIAPVIRRLVTPAGLRARVYDRDGSLMMDTRSFYGRGDITRLDLPPPSKDATVFQRTWSVWKRQFGKTELTPLDESLSGRLSPQVQRALSGTSTPVVQVNAVGETIVTYTLPIQRLRITRGALQLSTEDGDIDEVIAKERLNIFVVFLIVTTVMALLSLFLANTIAKPVERLAVAAERVGRDIKLRQNIPDFSARSDEIGHLSIAVRGMTDALYSRIAAIESFAADVAHELKNPLTSLRSAVETLPRVKTEDARARLLGIIQHDVRRLDRLISDISDASRLDAELAKADTAPVDMLALLEAVVSLSNDMRKPNEARIILSIQKDAHAETKSRTENSAMSYSVTGHDSRLAQVFTNLLDNARSFSPAGSVIEIQLSRTRTEITITVLDEGPGVPAHASERIFERFYTDRPTEHGFGHNSGLGLAISRQIIEAHRGRITCSNRPAKAGNSSAGACFTVILPTLDANT